MDGYRDRYWMHECRYDDGLMGGRVDRRMRWGWGFAKWDICFSRYANGSIDDEMGQRMDE